MHLTYSQELVFKKVVKKETFFRWYSGVCKGVAKISATGYGDRLGPGNQYIYSQNLNVSFCIFNVGRNYNLVSL